MKQIELNGKYGSIIGNYALVDDEDYEELNKYKWRAYKNKSIYYAVKATKNPVVMMHRLILNINNDKLYGDHIDGNGLNNTRENLRVATHSQNQANRHKINGTSQYLGVYKNSTGKGWTAKVSKNKKVYIKHCQTEINAAIEYNKLARKHHGEFAKLNNVNEDQIEETIIYKKPIIQYTLSGEYIREWDSVFSVRAVGMASSSIRKVIQGKHKHAYGYKWKYKHESK